MGEISEGLIDGTFDSLTGEYIGEGPGYPRVQTNRGIKPYVGGKYNLNKRRKRFDNKEAALNFAAKVNGKFNDLRDDPKSKSRYSVTYNPNQQEG